ncbi:glycosyltransferase family 2 protein [Cohnella endophytica]|uniref:glycosyltransferase family 2 protein n=1 Tax=Cohnella endophytica TaxID=2419778 RepID=UPI0013145890|nr:glycosyltransferase [Cohnella endophytica]
MLVSIIIPVYNTEKFVRRSIESALAQTYSANEIILVNDGSTDRSPQICDEYASTYPRITVIHQLNKGVSAARNAGMDAARGEFIQFLDSDDEIESTMTESLVHAIREQDCDLVVCGYVNRGKTVQEIRADSNVYEASEFMARAYTTPNLAPLTWSSCNMLFRSLILRDHKLRFDSSFVMGEDGLFMLEYMSRCRSIYVLNRVLYNYYQYDPADRVSAITYFSPDLYSLRIKYFERLYSIVSSEISQDLERQMLRSFFNLVIISLVYMGAYAEFFTNRDLLQRVKSIINHPYVRKASKVYKRSRKTDSAIIPRLIRMRMAMPLVLLIRSRGKKFVVRNGKRQHIRSVYRENRSLL